jgi:hypothetical protein
MANLMEGHPHQNHLGLMNRKQPNGLGSLSQKLEGKEKCQLACKPGFVGPKA